MPLDMNIDPMSDLKGCDTEIITKCQDEYEKQWNSAREERLYKKLERKLFRYSEKNYYVYRFVKKIAKCTDGCIIGMADGFSTGMCCGCKWGGAGGWIIGGIAQGVAVLCGSFSALFIGFVFGLTTDTETIMKYWQNYRETIGNGAENVGYKSYDKNYNAKELSKILLRTDGEASYGVNKSETKSEVVPYNPGKYRLPPPSEKKQ